MDLEKIVDGLKDVPVLVAGDIMLDIFIYGEATRISPEGPVPVLKSTRESRMLGGAGNVLSNLAALGAKPYLYAVTGADDNGREVAEIARRLGAQGGGIITDPTRPTIVKTRFVAQNQQLLRVDSEKTQPLDTDIESALLAKIEEGLSKVRAVILSDYGKGTLTKTLIAKIIAAAGRHSIPVLVDPKGHDYSLYRGADIVTPNRKELSEATGGRAAKSDAEIIEAAEVLLQTSGIRAVVATRSEDGMSIIRAGTAPLHLRTQAREVFDVSGAGDTVISTLAAALAAGATLEDAAHLANLAGGIAVSKIGTTPVRREELKSAVRTGAAEVHGAGHLCPVADDWIAAKEIIDVWKAKGLRVGFTNGCFDILHEGHVRYLAQARGKCDRLIVAVNHDISVKLLKGPTRPVNAQSARAAVLSALASTDLVVYFGAEKEGADNTPAAVLDVLRPDICFKGGDYKVEDLPEAKIVLGYGGQVEIMTMHDGFSTTSTIARMKA